MTKATIRGVSSRYKMATLAGGCFWCTEALFLRVKGVEKVISGYSGGNIDNPSYEKVSSGISGHAEVIQITYDPKKISYKNLLYIFFRTHDPTTLNRQGADVGSQYRSVIFYHDKNQKKVADKAIKDAQKDYTAPIVTKVLPFETFYKAEDYHQNYFSNNPEKNYCKLVINPKIKKLQQDFKKYLA